MRAKASAEASNHRDRARPYQYGAHCSLVVLIFFSIISVLLVQILRNSAHLESSPCPSATSKSLCSFLSMGSRISAITLCP